MGASVRNVPVVVALALALVGRPLVGTAQERGALAGYVVDELTLERLSGVTVSVLDADLAGDTDDFGQFLLEGVPAGLVSLRIAAPGYVTVVERLEVAETDFLQIRLSPVAAALDELLVITGRRTRAEVSATRAARAADGIRTALDILADGVPGVTVHRGGGNLGTGAAIAIRGAGSFRNNRPAIFVDGVRIDDRSGGEKALNVLDLIPAEDVARIRVLRGPAAAAQFAFGANGIVLIETVRGGVSGG